MNGLYSFLVDNGFVNEEQLEVFHPRVRDRDDIKVLRDAKSGVFLLSKMDHAL